MASVMLRRAYFPAIQRWYSGVAVPLSTPIETNTPAEGTRNPAEEVKVSNVNGLTVASVETHSFLSNVSVYLRAGSRYESYDQQGLTHLLRNCAYLGNDDRSAFRIAREIDSLGGTLSATSTREHMIYSSSFLRGSMVEVMGTLGSMVSQFKFKPWEVDDRRYTLSMDLAQVEATPFTVVLEGLHQVAYRNALCNSLYCSPRNFSKFTSGDLESFMRERYTTDGTVVVGVGVNHGEFTKCIENSFAFENMAPSSSSTQQAEYVGGGELRVPSNSDLTYAAVVSKGASRKGAQEDLMAAGILQHLLGAEPKGYIKWGSNSTSSRLPKAGALVTDAPFSAAALNINYSDSGLFGIYVVCEPSDCSKLLKTIMKEFSEVARGNVSDEDIARAKNQLKTRYLMDTEPYGNLVEDIGNQVNTKGSYSPVSETISLLDSVKKDDIVRFARAVFATKASYVAHGNLSNAPRLDQLLAEVSLK